MVQVGRLYGSDASFFGGPVFSSTRTPEHRLKKALFGIGLES
jgi:hypothetical protein